VVHSFDTTVLGRPLLATFLARALMGRTVGATVGLIEATLAPDARSASWRRFGTRLILQACPNAS